MSLSRREFIKTASALGVYSFIKDAFGATGFLEPVVIDNPFAFYPNRDWEKVYRDISSYDSSFVFLCAPNDTHDCLLRAYVKNDAVVRIGPTFGYGKAQDLYGNKASARWDPRCCQKGLTLVRRFYGDRRCKAPLVRKGFKEWVENGFKRDGKGMPARDLFRRGEDSWVKVSWDEAFDIIAKTYINIAQTYSGDNGKGFLEYQGYDDAMIEATEGAGTRTLKFRGGMPLLGATRIYALYRFANMMALLDSYVRGVGPDTALGGKGWDNYSWHTDLPPGHPMVTGQQTVDWDLFAIENSDLALIWGMNWICTKMPDSHWLTEAKAKGTKIIVISVDYSATASKGDEVLVIRPGTDSAFALGLAYVLINEKLYDEDWIKRWTDLPLLVKTDDLTLLRAKDIIKDYKNKELSNFTKALKEGETPPLFFQQSSQYIPEKLREEWGDFVVWDMNAKAPLPISRDQIGVKFEGINPALEGEFEIETNGGKKVKVMPIFDLVKSYIFENFSPQAVSEITWAPEEAILNIAREIAKNKEKTLFAVGMGPNQFFNADLKDRAIFLVAALTRNVGFISGNVGSYAGNYRAAIFNGLPQYIAENPFAIELDPQKPVKPKPYWKGESAHYYNYGDRPLRLGNKLFTGKGHIPTPTKAVWLSNSNSILGNAKWHYDVVMNTLPKIDMMVVSEWWWSATCEYADVVLPVDSWAELKFPDMTAQVTNPFLCVFPRTPLPRIFDTKSDMEVVSYVAKRLADLTGDKKFELYWKFVFDNKVDVYLQRIINASNALKGYKIEELEARAKEGIPALVMTRTYPRSVGYEHPKESRPWYTKTGRLEFYREEPEFIEYGENLPVYREPVDSTFYEPNVIIAKPHVALRPATPEKYGLDPNNLSVEVRQVRNVAKPWVEVKKTSHPLAGKGFKFIFHTPKYRHGAHTTPVDTDMMALFFGPFTDVYRRDKRMPYVGEGYVDINPLDASELNINDGDYVWIDADPEDRPYRGWGNEELGYKVSRLLCRARYYSGTPRGVTRMWFNMYGATFGSVKAHETREDGLAKNLETGYQAMFRYGSHQSGTRAWLRPTLMTDSLVRKEVFGQLLGKGFLPDVHCPVGAPRESFVKIEKAEDGGFGGKWLWRPVELGLRPTYENQDMKIYLSGGFVIVKK